MPLFIGSPEPNTRASLDELQTPFLHYLRAKWEEQGLDNYTWGLGGDSLAVAEANRAPMLTPGTETESPTYGERLNVVGQQDANDRAKAAGIPHFDAPADGYTEKALNLLIERQKQKLRYQYEVEHYPFGVGSAAGFITQLASGLRDPIQLVTAAIPIIAPAKYTMMLAKAAGPLARAGVRAGVGALEGGVATAALEPFAYMAHQGLQDDYKMLDSLMTVGFGAAFGGALHVGFGGMFGKAHLKPDWQTQDAATRTAVAQNLDGRVTNVEAVVRTDPAVTRLNPEQRQFVREAVEAQKAGADTGVQALRAGEAAPPVPEGMVRYYHGGSPEDVTGSLWFTSHLPDAEGWASRSPDMKLWYVDVPKDSRARGGEPEFGVEPPSRMEFPSEIAGQRKVFSGSSPAALERAIAISRKPAFQRTPEERAFLAEREDLVRAVEIARIEPYQRPPEDQSFLAEVTREPTTLDDMKLAQDKQQQPESIRVVGERGVKASADADKVIAESPKETDLRAAEAELKEIEQDVMDRAQAVGFPEAMVRAETAEADLNLVKAMEWAKAAKAAFFCGIR